jgi:hypothetical protein
MASGREAPSDQRIFAAPCRRCGSRLPYTVDGVWGDSDVILERCCPECENRETVVVSVWAASARYREETRTLLAMQVLADSLRDGFSTGWQFADLDQSSSDSDQRSSDDDQHAAGDGLAGGSDRETYGHAARARATAIDDRDVRDAQARDE